ncbi:hypothetical protein B0H14DRAFT_3422076 [Mycena olivaceomarginata]|nr:hypothetical protein B0H14DRAFT_3422076 [Mycena olivaceomarginata]
MYNTKVSAIMRRLNEGQAFGDRYSLPETKSMIKKDPSMLDDFTDKELVEIKASLEGLQQVKQTGVRANNQAAVADAKFTLNQLSEKINDLAECMGRIGFAMFT